MCTLVYSLAPQHGRCSSPRRTPPRRAATPTWPSRQLAFEISDFEPRRVERGPTGGGDRPPDSKGRATAVSRIGYPVGVSSCTCNTKFGSLVIKYTLTFSISNVMKSDLVWHSLLYFDPREFSVGRPGLVPDRTFVPPSWGGVATTARFPFNRLGARYRRKLKGCA